MNWKALNNGRCPKCNFVLKDVLQYAVCHSCNFRVSHQRLKEIVENKPTKYVPKSYDDSLSELNNMGHDIITEDFSDSPYL